MNRTEHLLAVLAEECNEVAQRAMKAQRFGLLEVQPEQDKDNWTRLMEEYNDLVAVLGMISNETELPARLDPAQMQAKREKVERYMAYAESQGALEAQAGSKGGGGWGMSKWKLSMKAEPIVPAWTSESECRTNGAELQTAILRGFFKWEHDPIWGNKDEEFTVEKTFTFKEHGEFFRGALTMAGIRYANDFFELLQRYGTIKVTIIKHKEEHKP